MAIRLDLTTTRTIAFALGCLNRMFCGLFNLHCFAAMRLWRLSDIMTGNVLR
jgi:hypothetical protein